MENRKVDVLELYRDPRLISAIEKWNLFNFLDEHNIDYSLDGKHIACKAPPRSWSQYCNYKGFYSIVLMALVDDEYKFIWADFGATGAASDAHI